MPAPALGDRPGPPLSSRFGSLTAPVTVMARRNGGGSRCVGTGLGTFGPSRRAATQVASVSSRTSSTAESNSIRSWSRIIVESRTSSRSSDAGQGLGDSVEGLEQLVGLDEPSEPVEGQRLLAL